MAEPWSIEASAPDFLLVARPMARGFALAQTQRRIAANPYKSGLSESLRTRKV
jgi:hypothetical protein